MRTTARGMAALLLGVFLAGCSGHVHVAPHGGTLVPLGEHTYNLEFVRDAAAGRLSLYVLDGHAEDFIRIKAATLEATLGTGGEQRPVTFNAVANSATGESVGNTAQFDATADTLKASTPVRGTLSAIDIRGTTFKAISFEAK
jgi:hypothetical protein